MITIIGAGLGGLTLARILHLNGVDVRILERDASPSARHQGGMLDIHEESGQAALRMAGLQDPFMAATLPGGDAFKILDKTGTVHWAEDGDGARPEIERGALRGILLSSLPEGMVRWGIQVTDIRRAGNGFEIMLADGGSLTTELLVGADGAWSKVRPLLSAAIPAYSGLSFAEARIFDADRRWPELAATVGGGMMFALSDGKGFLAHREPNAELCIYAALQVPAGWADGPITRDSVLAHFPGWSDDLRDLIARSDTELVPRAIAALSIGHRWDRVPGVTLVGDAAHLMSPFAGEGANIAMFDGAELARVLLAHPGDVELALSQYEEAMFARAAEAAADSAMGLETCFAPDAPRPLVKFFSSMQNPPEAAAIG